MLPSLENSYRKLPALMYEDAHPVPVSAPKLIALNKGLAESLGLRADDIQEEVGAVLAGNGTWPGSEPVALAYAGHQFGGFSGRLGDGRAHLLGELIDREGRRFDVQLKGSGPTPYSRGGDGRSALGPVIREYLVSEWMHAMGVPTTRALAAVATGDLVYRETPLPGGVLTRIASSHLRVGSFEFVAALRDTETLRVLVDYALERHAPEQEDPRLGAIRLLDLVIEKQSKLIAQWMGLGFIHGVMNTDNCAISGETLDYGPCALMDSFDPSRKFSSIDRGGRYAYNQQAKIAQWNMARFAETLLPLIDAEENRAVSLATELLRSFPERYERHFKAVCQSKLGLAEHSEQAIPMMTELMQLMRENKADFTTTFRRLFDARSTDAPELFLEEFDSSPQAKEWWNKLVEFSPDELTGPTRENMLRSNPLFIPRNHRVEEVIAAALTGDLSKFERLRTVLQRPCETQSGAEDLLEPPGEEQWSYVTFCGT